MDRSTDGDGPVSVVPASEEILQPERRSVRRRLVQSTLFPHKSPEIESNFEQKRGKECNGEEDEEVEDRKDEEYSGSQGKKRRTRKGKTTPQTRTPKKSKEKSPGNGTPKKNVASNGKASAANLVESQDASPPIPNLRLEAKMTAEENSRMFAGKQIHPFFSSWKVSKRCNETTEAESSCCPVQRKDNGISIGPIHVFERDQDIAMPLDWGNWKFNEKPYANSIYSLEGPLSSNFEGFIGTLHFNDFPSASHSPGTILLQDNASFDQFLSQQVLVHETPEIVCAMPSDAHVTSWQLVEDTETDCEVVDVGLFPGCVKKSDVEQQSDLSQERIMSSYLSCTNQLDDRLWTDKYRPEKAMELCGNDESVKFLSEWLHNWQQGHQARNDTSGGPEYKMQDADFSCFQSDSDSENIFEEASLKNVLLITGPIGSGKSAAIYACAKEEGFKVLEASASECRNGTVVKQRFGEALESHSVEWSQEIHVESTKSSTALPNGKSTLDSGCKLIEVVPISDEDIFHGATEASAKLFYKDSAIACGRGQLKHLILFEDVDITFAEDRGFVTAIQQIAEKAKGPVILTSNSDNPVLPANLDRLEVCFMMPSEKELLQHVDMICSAEKVNIQHLLLKKLVEYCQGDIRKTIMHLQFWFQGKQISQVPPNREVQRLFAPSLFDPEAGHQMLPKIMPWDFPSQLAQLIEKEMTTSLSMMEDKIVSMEVVEEEFDVKEIHNNIQIHNYETDSIEAKKEAMLSQNCSDQDCNNFEIPLAAFCVFSSPGTPVSFSRRNSRRKLDVVMSSDSEDDLGNERVPLTSEKDTNNDFSPEADGRFPSHCLRLQNCLSPSIDMPLCSGTEQLEGNYCQCPETAFDSHIKGTLKSVDVSCVSESTFVPETEINDGTKIFATLFCGQVADTLEEVSVTNELKQNLCPVETDNHDTSLTKLHKDPDMLGCNCDVIAVSSHEEVEDSQNEHMETISREYQVMDECSRIDFNKKFKPMEKLRSSVVTDLVRESWRKLRDHSTDLRHFVTSEQNDAAGIVELSYGMSNLISEAELMLSRCQTLESLELSTVLSEVSDVFSWCDEHLQMTSTVAEYGFCLYAKDIIDLGLKLGSECKVDLTCEKPAASAMEFGSLTRQNLSCGTKSSTSEMGAGMSVPKSGISTNSEMKSCLFDIIQSMVPSRSYMTLKGDAFYEYLSSLGHIARLEASRLSVDLGKMKRRRGRAARNYLSTGSLMLSPEEISLLGQSNIYGKSSSQTMDS